ncbi:MAG: hypothetical protein RRZ69_06095, partial [Clostridia bacterium]
MRKKGIIFTILIILLVLAILATLFLLIFNISEFNIDYTNNPLVVNQSELETYINSYKGTNTFLFNKEEFINDVQAKFPYIIIQNVERIPFNKVTVTMTERLSLFAINSDSKYYLFDAEGFLLEQTDINAGANGSHACIEITGLKDKSIGNLPNEIGTTPTMFSNDDQAKYILQFFDIMKRLERSYTDLQLKGFCSEIEIDLENNLTISTRYGTTLIIYNFNKFPEEKVQSIMGAFTQGLASDP